MMKKFHLDLKYKSSDSYHKIISSKKAYVKLLKAKIVDSSREILRGNSTIDDQSLADSI